MIKHIRKRDGRLVSFNPEKITEAVFKATKATGEPDRKKAGKITRQIVTALSVLYKDERVPTVENVQDLVERMLIEDGYTEVAKVYILYREQHAKLRDTKTLLSDAVSMVDKYLGNQDWRVKENSNMSYSLQGLNNHIFSLVTSNYWLSKLYPSSVKDAHTSGDIHIHDIGVLAVYCCGWDLKDLLTKGFGGASGKVEASPPKHFRTALGQLINFFYTLQGEAAGAQAFSNFDTLLSPFIRYDSLSYKDVRQCIQEFIFNMNIPTRVGFQCISEDTEILTKEGWKGYSEVSEGDIIKTFNIKTLKIEDQKITYIFKKHYEGVMYRLRNRIQDQLISPQHKVVRKKFNTDSWTLEPIEDVLKLKSNFIIPISANNSNPDVDISDCQIKLMTWIISEGSIERPGKHRCCHRVSIYQSKIKNPENYNEIINLLSHFKLKYSEGTAVGLGEPVVRIRLDAESSKIIHGWFLTRENVHFIPSCLLNLSERQSRIFLETYLKADGFEGSKIATTEIDLLDDLEIMCVNAGYGFTVLVRKPTIGKKDVYVLRLIKHQETYIKKVEHVEYNGVIWSPHTVNETIVARRNGKVFITGNTPFTNITMDVTTPRNLAKEYVIIGGKPQDTTYSEFKHEMLMINKAFCEVMGEGDAKGRIFTFPIPTYNITKDFNWDDENLKPLWDITSKYGIPYFSNFINSDMDPEDARSMCPLAGNEKVLVKSSRGRVVEYSMIRNIYEGNSQQEEYEIYSDGRFIKGKFNKFDNQKMVKITLENGHEIKMSEEHLNFVMVEKEEEQLILKGRELKSGIYLPYSLNAYKGEGGNKDLGYFVGAYAGDGSLDGDNTVVFSLEGHYKKDVITKLERIAKEYFGAHTVVKSYEGTKLISLKVHSKGAVGLCKDFVEDKGRNKHYNARLFAMGVPFRKGVLAGHYATDGGNRNRIYTSSLRMVETLNMLASTLGTTTSIYEDKREGRLGKEPNYAILFYQLNRKNYGGIWFKKGPRLWMRIKEIKPVENSTAYCFEVKNDEPVFTVGTTGILTHNCRLRLDNRELRNRGGGLFGSNPLTGSIGVVTMNLPKIAYLSDHNESDFFKRLANLMEIAKESLEIKRKVIERFTDEELYPYARHYLSSVKERFGAYWKNHFSTIGLIGMNEASLNLMGCDIASPKGKAFTIATLKYMREKILSFQEETENLYNIEATPAEGTAYRLAMLDKEQYPDIITAGCKKPYYTNSTHLPVGNTDDLFLALSHQDELQALYTGGTVFHGFIGEKIDNPDMCKMLVKKIAERFSLPYYTLTPTFSICPIHGYIRGEHFTCPTSSGNGLCNTKCEVYSRVVGYYRPVQQWNDGKQEEFGERREYRV